MRSWKAMRHDRQLLNEWDESDKDAYPELETWRMNLETWLTCYAPGHKAWMKVSLWWGYNVRRYPKPPPFNDDPVARHLGFVDGVPECQGPICQEHEWSAPPSVTGTREGEKS